MTARIRKTALLLLGAALATMALGAAPAMAEFGLNGFDVTFENEDGTAATQAGGHPFQQRTHFDVNSHPSGEGGVILDAAAKDVVVGQVPGLVGKPTAVPRCSNAEFLTPIENIRPSCADATAVGVVGIPLAINFFTLTFWAPLYNIETPPGAPATLGWWTATVPATPIFLKVSEEPPYNVVADSPNITQQIQIAGADVRVWGVPADPSHDPLRGECAGFFGSGSPEIPESLGDCPVNIKEEPFLVAPRACEGPLSTAWEADSWPDPETIVSGSVLSHDELGEPRGFTGCGRLGFNPTITSEPSTKAADSPTGLDFSLDVEDEGLLNPEGIADSDIRKAVVTLPQGMAANPSLAEGLGVCTEADLEAETLDAEPGEGCPNASKIGTVEVETQLLDEKVNGSLFVAKPYQNPFNSILALYIVIKNPKLGILVKQPLRVDRDPNTGQLTTVAEDLPQLPFSHFRLHFRSGARAPLSSPPACGTYEAKAVLYPWSGGEPVTSNGAFEIISGSNNGPCPTGGLPAFGPHLDAGTVNNAAGRFSPFYVRLSREDGEQEITHFSIKLPPGVIGKLAGIPFCSEADIAKAISREEAPHGGAEELASPSCPAAAEIGRTLAGAGVGPSLTYAPGKVYLAGPYHGAPISFVAITAGVVGPFDIGDVVVRQALRVNPETGEVFVDATGSDPIPHIVEGFPVDLRDIRVYVDRPQFVLNPTNCSKTSTASTVLGAGLDFASEADDNPLTVTSPFQAADCAQLPFEPKLTLRLKGGTNRGAHPALIAHLAMHGFGEAGVARSQVTLPHSEFIENSHFKTICTRVQFNAGQGNGEGCPPDSVYGHASALTPILSEALSGPIFLRSNPERELPDVVAALRGQEINAVLVGHVDSVKGGGIRTTFEGVPDAPVSEATFAFDGRSKGLFVNSTNLCEGAHRATVSFTGQNGKVQNTKPAPRVSCKARKGARHKRRGVR